MHPDKNANYLPSVHVEEPKLPVLSEATEADDEIEDDFLEKHFQLEDLTKDGEFSENFLNEVGEEEPFGSSAMDQQEMALSTLEPAQLRSLADLHKLMRGRRGFSAKDRTGTGAQKPKAVKKPKSKTGKIGSHGKPAKPVLQSWNDAKGFFFNKYPGEFLKEFQKEFQKKFGKELNFSKFLFDPMGVEEVPQLVEKIDKASCAEYKAKLGVRWRHVRKMLQDRQAKQIEDGLIKYK
ncbi:hypothetical protein CAEBREN_14212 [Caenorhabditis brenneri]|uniref:Uncharacterized protein n=1 Tax=Caenorhabditis brenneri TaxID=135651 RepID=G0MMT6_CAEBE|nr:hypothetical protein CAEBREN_14212 [Caenorhabditis brenneri]